MLVGSAVLVTLAVGTISIWSLNHPFHVTTYPPLESLVYHKETNNYFNLPVNLTCVSLDCESTP